MVKLRLKRMGKKKKPFYRIIAADSRAARDGRFIEMVGTYDPVAKPHVVECQEDRVFHWLSNGAQPTDTVRGLLRGKGLWLKWTLIKQGADEAKIASELSAWQKLQVEKAMRAEEKKAKAESEKGKKKAAEEEEAKQAESATQEAADEPVEEPQAQEIVEEAKASDPVEEPVKEKPAETSAPVKEVAEEEKTKTPEEESSEDETK